MKQAIFKKIHKDYWDIELFEGEIVLGNNSIYNEQLELAKEQYKKQGYKIIIK